MKLPLHAEGENRRVACQRCIDVKGLSEFLLGEHGDKCYYCCDYIIDEYSIGLELYMADWEVEGNIYENNNKNERCRRR